jgi:tripartite-type tricarboxylate transporter receptor subunit TctC
MIAPHIVRRADLDPVTALLPVAPTGRISLFLVVHPNVPAKDFAGFLAYARANPGKLNYGTPGNGTAPHIAGEAFSRDAGIRMTHVPYAWLAPALNDLLAGHTDVMIDNLGSSLQFVRQGKLRALAVTSTSRIPELPDLPPIADSYPEVVASAWFAVVAPPKTPEGITQKLSQAFAEILREPEIERRWRDMNLNAVGGTPDEIRKFFNEETERWRRVIVTGGIKPP